jgi:hypothetical protein
MSKKRKETFNWKPPENYKDFFYASSDEAFKAEHPIGYVFLVILGLVALFLPAILFVIVVGITYESVNHWVILGLTGGFVFGIGLFNYVAIIIKQYLGHWVSIVSFLIGGALMFVSWLLCR